MLFVTRFIKIFIFDSRIDLQCILFFLAQGDTVNEYCKLGCASSVCGAMTTLKNSGKTNFPNSLLLLLENIVFNNNHF